MKKKNIILSLSILLSLTSCKVVNLKSFKNEVTREDFYSSLAEELKQYEYEEIPSYLIEHYAKINYRSIEFYNISNKTINKNNNENEYVTYKYDSSTKVLEIKEKKRSNETTSSGSSVITLNSHNHYQNADGGSYYIDMFDSDYSFIENYTYKDFAPFMQYLKFDSLVEAYEDNETKMSYYKDNNVYTFAIDYVEAVGEDTNEKDIRIQFVFKEKKITVKLADTTKIVEADDTKTRTTRRVLNENYTFKIKNISMKAQDMTKFYFYD